MHSLFALCNANHFIARDKHYISQVAYILVLLSLPLKVGFYGHIGSNERQEISQKL